VGVSRPDLLRKRDAPRAERVTNMELFFDLVYVFAFTQLSELLYEHPSWLGGAETAVIFVALWWAWIYTTWATGLIDPNRSAVVLLLSVMMIASLVMATAILESFDGRGPAFAIAYVGMQLLCGGFMVWVFGTSEPMGRNYAHLLVWLAISGVIWIIGAFVDDPHTRLLLWALAAAVDVVAPLLDFRLPLTGATPVSQWALAGGHLAERCQLLLMIAFGESFLRIGESFAAHHGTVPADTGFISGFVLVFTLWTIYFLRHAERSARTIAQAGENAARLARSAYTYMHALMVGAVIVLAVAIHEVIEAPKAEVDVAFTAICAGGPALYLIGFTLSRRWLGHGYALWALAGVAGFAVVAVSTVFGVRLVELLGVTAVALLVSLRARRSG
jgi:low temperature requirement protein LtrA